MQQLTWEQSAAAIGDIVQVAAERHPEILPLYIAWRNFARKRGLRLHHGKKRDKRVRQLEDTLRRQAEEIEALEYRIKTLER